MEIAGDDTRAAAAAAAAAAIWDLGPLNTKE
jgi:hypothetical protein